VATGETTLSPEDDQSDEAWRVLIHDFRNLLAVIINYSELIAEEAGDPEAVRADIAEVRAAAERAIALTEKLRRPAEPTVDAHVAPDASAS
jgi:signal transduction histidine kinase